MSSSVGGTIPNIYGKIKAMFQTTNQFSVLPDEGAALRHFLDGVVSPAENLSWLTSPN